MGGAQTAWTSSAVPANLLSISLSLEPELAIEVCVGAEQEQLGNVSCCQLMDASQPDFSVVDVVLVGLQQVYSLQNNLIKR